MENAAEHYDLITVLLRLESFKGQASKVDRSRSVDDLGVAAADGGQGDVGDGVVDQEHELGNAGRATGQASDEIDSYLSPLVEISTLVEEMPRVVKPRCDTRAPDALIRTI